MSLSGNLGFVSLDEVLRLLTRSKQRGAVDVRGEKVRGRIFVNKGGVGLATTFSEDSLERHLVKSGLVGEGDLREERFASIAEQDGGALSALLREMTVESIYQLGMQGESFEVYESEYSPYANPKTFDLEDLLSDSKQRLNDWADVTQVVSDLDRTIRFRHDLGGRDEIKIDKDAWRMLSELGEGRSVRVLADELGTTEFWTARTAARLVQEDLVELEPGHVAATEPEPVSERWEDTSPVAVGPAETPESVDPNQSWWTEPERGEETEEAEYDEQVVEETAPAAEHEEDAKEVEEDTEAFLEKVFSELETEETEEGYGLLRRRRMGTMRDHSVDGG